MRMDTAICLLLVCLVNLRTVEQAEDVYQSGMTFLRQHLHLTKISARQVEWIHPLFVSVSSCVTTIIWPIQILCHCIRQNLQIYRYAGKVSFNGLQSQKYTCGTEKGKTNFDTCQIGHSFRLCCVDAGCSQSIMHGHMWLRCFTICFERVEGSETLPKDQNISDGNGMFVFCHAFKGHIDQSFACMQRAWRPLLL